MSKEILFSIPDFYKHYELNMITLDLMKELPDCFYDDVVIDSVYGSFPCPWAGGRPNSGYIGAPDMYAKMANFNSNGVSIRHAFNNILINESHLGDITGNAILDITSRIETDPKVKNGCTVNSKVLADHIKSKYPDMYIVWSTTKELSDIDTINELSKDNLLVVSYNFNNDFEKLKQLKHPENIEILCSEEGCIENCPNRNKHQEFTSMMNMYDLEQMRVLPFCPAHAQGCTYFYSSVTTRGWYISIDDIREKYLPLGFNKFKISGRSGKSITSINTIENYVTYFVKPEHIDDIRNRLLIKFFELYDRKLNIDFIGER